MSRSINASRLLCAEPARPAPALRSLAAALLAATLAAAITLAVPAAPAAAQDVPVRAEADEAFVSVKYADVVNVVVNALVWRDSLYLPILDLFRHLQIDVSHTPNPLAVHGFYVHPQRTYRLDFAAGTARLAGTQPSELSIDRAEFLPDSSDIYVRASLLERVFGLQPRFDVSALTVRVESTRGDTMPVLQARYRANLRPRPELAGAARTAAPLRFDRTRHRFNGGVFDYSAAGTIARSDASLVTNLGVGVEVLGGDVVAAVQFSASAAASKADVLDARWQYVTSDSAPWLTAARVGSLTSSGLRSVGIHGIQLTNAPLITRARLGSQDITGHTSPGWEVDLELNGQLIDRTRADAEGYYRFTLPLGYGAPVITLRRYGPTGEVEIEHRRLSVPVTVLPRGTFEYTFSAGQMRSEGGGLAQLRAGYGVSGLLTALTGFEYTQGKDTGLKPVFGVVARLPWSFAASAEFSPGLLTRVQLDAIFQNQANATVTLEQFPGRSFYNPLAVRRSLRFLGFTPLQVADLPFSLRFAADVQRLLPGGYSFGIDPELTLNLSRFKPRIGYQRSVFRRDGISVTLRDVASAGVTGFISNPPEQLGFLAGGLVGAGARYDLNDGTLQGVDIDFSRNITRTGRIAFALGHDFQARNGYFEARFVLDRQTVQATSSLSATRGSMVLTQLARGSVSFDPETRTIHRSNRDWVGRAGTVFRTFVDADGDAAYDPGETLVTGADLRFRQSVSARNAAPGILRTEDLLSYHRYSVDVEAQSTPNPLWRPAFTEFSFITDPNAYKYIDIPFYIAGVVEGIAEQLIGTTRRGIPGLVVHIRNSDGEPVAELTTFSDGSWYLLGIPPGNYTASIERAQLSLLRLTTEKLTLPFTVRQTADGDMISGINFVLTPAVVSTGG